MKAEPKQIPGGTRTETATSRLGATRTETATFHLGATPEFQKILDSRWVVETMENLRATTGTLHGPFLTQATAAAFAERILATEMRGELLVRIRMLYRPEAGWDQP